MELVITALYIWVIWLVWYKFKWLKPNIVWKVTWPSLWVAAISLELISLGQFCPYGKNAFIWTFVYQMAPEYGGIVTEVPAKPNVPMKKGDTLFQMDPTPWEYDVRMYSAQLAQAKEDVKESKAALDEAEADLISARQQEKVLLAAVDAAKADVERASAELKISQEELAQFQGADRTNSVAKLKLENAQNTVNSQKAELDQSRANVREAKAQLTQLKIGGIPKAQAARDKAELAYNSKIDGEFTEVAQIQAQLDKANYQVKSTTLVAPVDGYVVDLNLQPGVEIRMKQQVLTFVDGDPGKYWVVAVVPQFGLQRVRPGDPAEVMLKLYPSEIFKAEVVDVVWATGEAQAATSASLPNLATLGGGESGGNFYAVKLALKDVPAGFTPRFGASGKAAIYPKVAPDVLVLLRRLEIRMDSWVSYLYR